MILSFFLEMKPRTTICCAVILLLMSNKTLLAQEQPPQPISIYVNPEEALNFGAFYPAASGGTITVSTNGSRTVTGDVVPINQGFTFSAATFEVGALPGTIIHVQNGPDAVLFGSNGGTMTLHLEDSDPFSPFISNVAPPGRTQVRISGTLIVGDILTNKPGNYTGTFTITFNQE